LVPDRDEINRTVKIKWILSLLLLATFMTASGQNAELIRTEASRQAGYAFDLCKQLHEHPELSFQEFETAKRMPAELEKLGFTVTRNFGGNSVVGVYKNGDGPVVMLCTDMDALPVEEKTGLEFASTRKAGNPAGHQRSGIGREAEEIHNRCPGK